MKPLCERLKPPLMLSTTEQYKVIRELVRLLLVKLTGPATDGLVR